MAEPKRATGAGPGVEIREKARGRWVLAASWAYAAFVLGLLGLVHWVADAWWGSTVVLFTPKVAFLGPVVLLAVASAARRCPAHWLLQGATALVVAGPLMGASLPVAGLLDPTPEGDHVRVVTYNLGTVAVRVNALRDWADRERVDVLCVQEPDTNAEGLRKAFGDGWHVSKLGRVVSRLPIVEELPMFKHTWDTDERYSSFLDRVRLKTRSGRTILVASIHLPTIRPGFERFFATHDPAGLTVHTDWWAREAGRAFAALADSGDDPLIVAGDFNMPPRDATMAALRGHFRFAFDEAGWGYGYTRPSKRPFVRIDQVLAGPEWAVAACRVGPDFGSDHLPVLAEVVLPWPNGNPETPSTKPSPRP